MINTQTIHIIKAERRQRQRRWFLVNGLLVVLGLVLCSTMLLLGNTIYSINVVIRTLMGESIDGASFAINTIRLPRMLAGLLAGFAFGIAGNVFQTMLRNPLANPEILGITAGSSAAALFCILVLQTSNAVVSMSSLVAGLVTVMLIYGFARIGTFSTGRLILIGISFQAMLGAFISYLQLIGRQEDLSAALRWLSGSLNGSQLDAVIPLLIGIAICAPIVIGLSRHLSILELGDQAAVALGLNTNVTRVLLIVSSVCMIALATSVTGPIAFVAFLAGPIAKRLIGGSASSVIPAGLLGMNLVLGADLLGQFAFGTRFPVGIITGVLGAPFLLFLLIQMNRRGNL